MAQITETPMMKQYETMKKNHPDAIILFRVGDFYETFSDDAIAVSEICGVTLTRRYNGKENSIELAGFPHHALDTYLPKIIRAGKRVAICEQIEDGKQKVVEKVTPNQETTTKTNKPEKKMETKKINCDLSDKQLRELGEPVAYFSAEIPKEVKNIGKYTEDAKTGAHPMLQSVCLEPGNGKLIASDTRILYTVNVDCVGVWPETTTDYDKNLERDITTPFRCYIDPKAMREFAGKQIDIAVWLDDKSKHKVTACEAVGVLSQHSIHSRMQFPDWQRVIPKDYIADIKVSPEAIKPLREFLKANMGKTKGERETRQAVIHITPEADNIQIRIIESGDCGEIKEITAAYFDLVEKATHYGQQCYNEQLFYYSVLEDFNGEIRFSRENGPATFMGEQRVSILMPLAPCDEIKTYLTTEKPESK